MNVNGKMSSKHDSSIMSVNAKPPSLAPKRQNTASQVLRGLGTNNRQHSVFIEANIKRAEVSGIKVKELPMNIVNEFEGRFNESHWNIIG